VASSTTPGIPKNSCSTPSIFTAVMAAPSNRAEQRANATRFLRSYPAALKGCAENARTLSEPIQLGRKTAWFLKTLPNHRFLPSGRKSGPKTNTMPVRRAVGAGRAFETYFEYNSTMSCSLIGRVWHLIALRIATTWLELFALLCEPGHRVLLCATYAASSTMGSGAFFLDGTSSPTLNG